MPSALLSRLVFQKADIRVVRTRTYRNIMVVREGYPVESISSFLSVSCLAFLDPTTTFSTRHPP